jgi:cation diffusion facilitator family transporter
MGNSSTLSGTAAMMTISTWIARRVAPGYQDEQNLAARARIGLLEGWVGVIINTLLFAVKIALGLFTGSIALIADAVHTFADSGTSLVVILGFKMSRKPADMKHPFGHGRMESIASIVIAALLGVIALEMFHAAIDRIAEPQPVVAPAWVIAVVLVTLVIKELLSQFSFDLGKLINSDALVADGWHHRSDVLATGLVIVAFFGARYNLPLLDGIMGVAVAFIIAWAAWATMANAVGPLLGQPAPPEMYHEIRKIAMETAGVRDVHDILVHRYGTLNIISLHVEVSDSETPNLLHEISEEIEDRLAERYPGHAIVHVDPVNRGHRHYTEVEKIIQQAVAEVDGIDKFHDLRVLGGAHRFKVIFDISTTPQTGAKAAELLEAKVKARINEKFPSATVTMKVEPPYFNDGK